MYKVILLGLSALFITACTEKMQDGQGVEIASPSALDLNTTENNHVQESEKQEVAPVNPINQSEQFDLESFSCLGVELKNWYAFTERSQSPECKTVNTFKQLSGSRCSIEESAFGIDLRSIVIRNNTSDLFAYENKEKCLVALETRNNNGD